MTTMRALLLALLCCACSTAGTFRLPEHTTLTVAGHKAEPIAHHPGMLRTSAFGWSGSGSVPYALLDESGAVVRRGQLATRFRTGAVFFPPLLLVRPFGLSKGEAYDLTRPADGRMVRP